MKQFLLFIVSCFPLLVYAENEIEKTPEQHQWDVHVQTSYFTNNDWGFEVGATFNPWQYFGISIGVMFLDDFKDEELTGISDSPFTKNYTEWSIRNCRNRFALIAEVPITTPALNLSSNTRLALRVAPGITSPIPVNKDLTINETQHLIYGTKESITTSTRHETSKHGTAVFAHVKALLVLMIGDRWEVNAGYRWSNLDMYSASRGIKYWRSFPEKKQLNSYITFGAAFRF